MDSGGNVVKKLSGFHHDLHWRDICKDLLKFQNQVYNRSTKVLQAEVILGILLSVLCLVLATPQKEKQRG